MRFDSVRSCWIMPLWYRDESSVYTALYGCFMPVSVWVRHMFIRSSIHSTACERITCVAGVNSRIAFTTLFIAGHRFFFCCCSRLFVLCTFHASVWSISLHRRKLGCERDDRIACGLECTFYMYSNMQLKLLFYIFIRYVLSRRWSIQQFLLMETSLNFGFEFNKLYTSLNVGFILKW